ncbi:hypothetical protein L1994_05815 [Methanomicrobium antiquum]|uniref:Uncharacterized protein n=1 Tax=Methanomicrobium antiquum TaxID=487686 RepID=A0AAF0FX10_9EURY|nr:hypothetical protein [Methanomicrobium antiquum]WFN37898.1 hypothetical protein L1994_05815 [Methanomicrobium antiquum]
MIDAVPNIDRNQFPFQKIQKIQDTYNGSKLFDTKNKFCSIEFGRALHGFEYRYISSKTQEKRYFDITLKYGDTPPVEPINYRFLQDETIYLFFTCCLSLFDCYAYALYAACSHLDPSRIPLNNLKDGNVSFHKIKDKKSLYNFLKDKTIYKIIENTKDDPKYKDIQNFRNYLNHRAHLPRTIFLSTDSHILSRIDTIEYLNMEIKPNALCEYKDWIDQNINGLLEEFYLFLMDHF